jgi:hypothetical protein
VAQTRKKRRRKHRGTQSGTLDRRRAARPRNRKEAQARARGQRADKRDKVPTWGGAINRGLIAAGIFFVLLVLIFKRPIAPSLGFAAFMLAFYVPTGYYIDRFFWRRRQAQARAQRQQAKQAKDG